MRTSLKNQEIFKDFCELNNDRKKILLSIIEKEKIPYSIITLDGAHNIILFPQNLAIKSNVLLAHYDRVPNTPGANDNSASVFYLLYHAKRIKNINHSTIIIFTDKEEIRNSDSVTSQGSYALGSYFKSKKIQNLSFYVFDMCGIGTTILLGTGGVNLIKDFYKEKYETSKIKYKIDYVKGRAEDLLLTVNNGEFFYLTPLFSDDLGLILNEYPAILISLLPYREAVEYKNNPRILPKSWLNNHSLEDDISTLDSRSWDTLSPLLLSLSGVELPEPKLNICYNFNCYQQILNKEKDLTKAKPLLNYIIVELFSITNIQTRHQENLNLFHFLTSEISLESVNYFNSIFNYKSLDLTYDIYNFINDKLINEFDKLPIIVKDKINSRRKDLNYTDNLSFIYENIIKCLDTNLYINSKPINKKSPINIDIEELTINKSIFTLISNGQKLGHINLIIENSDVIINNGYFYPEYFLNYDPLNILKGLRVVLIKWTKLNNNNTLRFNLTSSNWIGCHQFYKLVSMELDKRLRFPLKSNLVYLWKRYYGKQS